MPVTFSFPNPSAQKPTQGPQLSRPQAASQFALERFVNSTYTVVLLDQLGYQTKSLGSF